MGLEKFTTKALLTHIFFFALFLLVPVLVFVRLPGESLFKLSRPFIQDMIADTLLLLFFYLNYYIFIPKLFFRQNYVVYVLCALACLFITSLVPTMLTGQFHDRQPDLPFPSEHHQDFPPPAHGVPVFRFVLDELRRHLYLFFTAVFFSFLLRIRERLDEIREDKLRAELASLKSQINPHFLFNTLNSIYVLSVKKDEKVSDAIIHLSGIMRYAIKDSNDAQIPLQKEEEYIEHYIELQKARIGNTASVSYTSDGIFDQKKIAPLLLITYIENAFKYGVNPDVSNCEIRIYLNANTDGVHLFVYNKKVPLSQQLESTGIGINNTKERLQYLYPNKHTLEIVDTNDSYTVNLSLKLV